MGSPPPPNPGPHRPPVPSIGAPPAIPPPNCPQCPIYINTIQEIRARLSASVMASEEDLNELRRYIAREQANVPHLRDTVGNHEAHVDNLDAQLIDAHADPRNYRETYNAVEPNIRALQDALERSEQQMAEYRGKAVEALKTQREESRRVYALSRANYEDQIMNLNVSHQLENTLGLAEVARLTEQTSSHALMSEGRQKLFDSLREEQQCVIVAQTARVLELESVLENSARIDESGVEKLTQRIAELKFGLENEEKYYTASSAAGELRIAELTARIETFEHEAKSGPRCLICLHSRRRRYTSASRCLETTSASR
eukprot:13575463-Heterocapsa_arctica.AAC.1